MQRSEQEGKLCDGKLRDCQMSSTVNAGLAFQPIASTVLAIELVSETNPASRERRSSRLGLFEPISSLLREWEFQRSAIRRQVLSATGSTRLVAKAALNSSTGVACMTCSHISMGWFGVFLLALAGAGCQNMETKLPPSVNDPSWRGADRAQGSVFGSSGIALFGDEDEVPASGIGVNAFLWRAALDTVSFMPLLSADPFGGVIITDWYAPPESPDERFKMTVYILGRTLRSDGIQVSVFRQERGAESLWEDRAVSPDTAVSLEDKILDRARQLRTAQLSR